MLLRLAAEVVSCLDRDSPRRLAELRIDVGLLQYLDERDVNYRGGEYERSVRKQLEVDRHALDFISLLQTTARHMLRQSDEAETVSGKTRRR